MTCEVVVSEALGMAFMCRSTEYCICGEVATHLCDVIVDHMAFEKARAVGDPDGGRCSEPLCDRCRHRTVWRGTVYDLCDAHAALHTGRSVRVLLGGDQ